MSETEIVATEFFNEATNRIKYMCELCKVSFCLRKNLNCHLKKHHQLQIVLKANQICVICEQKFTQLSLLYDHLKNDHAVALNFIDKTFYLEKDFLDWKTKIEKETFSFYTNRGTSKNNNTGIITTYYNCHRTGHFKMKQNRVRKVKASGSIKTGGTCPSGIRVKTQTVDGISEIRVRWQSLHLGHELETASCLRLTRDEKETFAACLRLGVTLDKILEQAKQDPSPTNRYRFLTRKHLHNIRRTFNIPNNEFPKRVNRYPAKIRTDDGVPRSNKKSKKARRQCNTYRDNGDSVNKTTKNASTGLPNISDKYEIPINSEKPENANILLKVVEFFKLTDSSSNNENHAENGVSNREEIQENEKRSAISSLENVVEVGESSNSYECCIETEVISHENIQENEKISTVSSLQNDVETSDSSNGYEDCVEVEEVNHEKEAAISSLQNLVKGGESSNGNKNCVEVEEVIHEKVEEHEKRSAISSLQNVVKTRETSSGYKSSVEIVEINHEKVQEHEKQSAISSFQNIVKARESSNGSENCVETVEINQKKMQEHEKNSTVSSLPLQQNDGALEQLDVRKKEICNQLKELQTRIEKWNPKHVLPNVEEHIKSINIWLDYSASTLEELKQNAVKRSKEWYKNSKKKKLN